MLGNLTLPPATECCRPPAWAGAKARPADMLLRQICRRWRMGNLRGEQKRCRPHSLKSMAPGARLKAVLRTWPV